MGAPQTDVNQMVAYYNQSDAKYDAFSKYGAKYDGALAKGGAPNIETFCQIFYEESVVEGVRPEVAFVQAMKETDYLRFGGTVLPNQYNFAGLGATGNGQNGNKFADVRTGIRAQIQHLKAYASTEKLVNPCVDPRFNYVNRGSAQYVEWLGIQENPNGVGWATDKNYGISISNSVNQLLSI